MIDHEVRVAAARAQELRLRTTFAAGRDGAAPSGRSAWSLLQGMAARLLTATRRQRARQREAAVPETGAVELRG
jgi:hypothetical protein